MTSYAAYLKPGRAPLLLPDRFSFWAFLFGPFWMLVHAAWIPALLLFALEIALRLLPSPLAGLAGIGLAWLVGLHAQDLRAWSLTRRGWHLSALVTERGKDQAYARLLAQQPSMWSAASLA